MTNPEQLKSFRVKLCTLDVRIDTLPSQTITLEQYRALQATAKSIVSLAEAPPTDQPRHSNDTTDQ